MGYLEEFQTQINNRDFNKFLQLWEEYCTSDTVEPEEFIELLKSIKGSDLAKPFGRIAETALPLWQTIKDEKGSYEVFKHLMDLETTNSPSLADTVTEFLKKHHRNEPQFNDRIRLIGLRSRDNFQGAVANYVLLAHMANGKFVFHTGGWGAGVIVDLSPVREQVSVEFENAPGRKHFTFTNAFKNLIPLPDEHFLVRRFADADNLEKEAKEDPVGVIKMLLRDLGPRSAAEIKDDLSELVIPEKEWTKWWQGARARIKKDPMVETPVNLKDSFYMRKSEMTQEEKLDNAMKNKTDLNDFIQSSYSFVRDLPNMRKHQDVKNQLKDKLIASLKQELTSEQELQILMLLENMFSHHVEGHKAEDLIKKIEDISEIVNAIDILALKKKALTIVREVRSDWEEIFLNMLFSIQQSPLRDYLLKELNQGSSKAKLEKRLKELTIHPSISPETFIWYFQKIVSNDEDEAILYNNKEGQRILLESFLILLSNIEGRPDYRDVIKKMYQLLSGKRYAIVRQIIEGANVEYLNEFLLLASKCQTLTDHDNKILRSLAEVVQPEIASKKARKPRQSEQNIIWTTEEGFFRTQDRLKHLGTIEIVENAREIEAARALGDLRENSEYKFALEKRSRLQGELKSLSEQFNRARMITAQDVHRDEAGIGSIIDITDPQGKNLQYTILGPWDADPEKHILSFQSKLAQAMEGCKEGDSFRFRDEDYTINKIKSFFDK